MAVRLGTLCERLGGLPVRGNPDLEIHGVTSDSRKAGPGILFVAVRGTSGDGHDFLGQAVDVGSEAVVVMTEGAAIPAGALAVVEVSDTRPLPALIAREIHRRPDTDLRTVGITGTNGKTTVAFLVRQMLGELEGPCGLMGTIFYDDGTEQIPAPLTTPAGPDLFAWLARMRDRGCRSVAMEISSHALDQGRAAGLELDVAVMTNIGRDHLDYHRDMDSYVKAKARIGDLLRPKGDRGNPGALVLNAGDPTLNGLETGASRVLRYVADPDGVVAPDAPVPDVRLVGAEYTMTGSRLQLETRDGELRIDSPLVGRYNGENLTAALAVGLALGLDPDACAIALAGVDQVPGRMERIALPGGAIAVVDYAHTPDALAAVLATCAELAAARILVVFGCGGDRDRGKRTLMGAVAARAADATWITSDNPRSEDPESICREILKGYEGFGDGTRSGSLEVIVDRTEAIEAAAAAAGPGDIVVVAGKGHEDYQLVADRVLELDDRRILRRWVAERSHDG